MRNVFYLLLVFFLIWGGRVARAQEGHSIKVQVKNYRDTTLYLGNYYGRQTYLVDSARMNGQGEALFTGKDKLPGGIYFILMPDKKKYFELLLDRQQHFEVFADTASLQDITFSHSPDNDLFSKYNHFLRGQQQKMIAAKQAGKDSVALQQLQKETGGQIKQYREDFIKNHPDNLLALIFRAMEDPQVPPVPKDKDGHTDSTFAYRYFKAHYWDHIHFNDNRIIRSPILETRLDRYFSQLVAPVPDSVNMEADKLLAKAKADTEVFKFVLWWLTYHYETSPYMGMDAVFVHLVEKYYITGEAYWLSKEQTQKIIERASQIVPNLIGNKAPDLALTTVDGKPVSLYQVKAKYTILVFWDPTCGHCMTEIPKLDSAYEARWKKEGVQMIGIKAGGTQEEWEKFIAVHHLEDWVNAWDAENKTNYRRLYDVYMTPVVYLLDERKKIVAKKLDMNQLDDFLDHLAEKNKEINKTAASAETTARH